MNSEHQGGRMYKVVKRKPMRKPNVSTKPTRLSMSRPKPILSRQRMYRKNLLASFGGFFAGLDGFANDKKEDKSTEKSNIPTIDADRKVFQTPVSNGMTGSGSFSRSRSPIRRRSASPLRRRRVGGEEQDGGKKKRNRHGGKKDDEQDGGKKKSVRRLRGGEELVGGKKRRPLRRSASPGRRLRGGEELVGGKKRRPLRRSASPGRRHRGGEELDGGAPKKRRPRRHRGGEELDGGAPKKRRPRRRSASPNRRR